MVRETSVEGTHSEATEPRGAHSVERAGLRTWLEAKRESLEATKQAAGKKEVAPDLRTTVWEKRPKEYEAPDAETEKGIGKRENAFEHPDGWIDKVNPGGPRGPLFAGATDARREVNCGDCARAVERNWRGSEQVAAGLKVDGERNRRTEAWSGEKFKRATIDDIGSRLRAAGEGSSAVIGVDWEHGGGHYFNAVNFRGEVVAVDGQNGRTESWPPSRSGLGYEAKDMRVTEAIIRDAEGRRIK